MVSKSVLSNAGLHSHKMIGPGVYFLPFTVAFPSVAERALHNSLRKDVTADMPPSLSVRGQGITVDVAYFLRVKVQRRGLFRLDKNKKISLPFRLTSPNLFSLPGDFSGAVNFAPLPAENFQTYQPISTSHDLLPPYTPSIRFRLAMSNQLVQPEQPLSLQLTVSTPRELLLQLGTLTLRSLLFRIQTTIKTVIDGLLKTYVTSSHICYLSGSISLVPAPEEEVCRLDPSLWQSYLVPPVQPSFSSQHISRTHVLEITAGFTSKNQQNTQVRECLPSSLIDTTTG